MALTNAGTAVYLDDDLLPSGYSKPSVTKFSDHEYKSADISINIAKSGVENAVAATTFAAIVAAITAAVTAIITADFDCDGLTVNCYANLKTVYHNLDLNNVLYTDGAINYVCVVDIFTKTAAL